MAAPQQEHGVQGSRPKQAALRCVLLGPDNSPTPEDLHQSLSARAGIVTRENDQYSALAHLIELDRTPEPGPVVLLLLEPQLHESRCVELARAVQLYAARAVVWQHTRSAKPALSAYILPAEPDEAEQIEQAREIAKAEHSSYERAVKASAGPSLRLVVDDDQPSDRHPSGSDHSDDDESEGLLSADEIEMLMDPLFETAPRRGGDQR